MCDSRLTGATKICNSSCRVGSNRDIWTHMTRYEPEKVAALLFNLASRRILEAK